jgi:UDP-N-acetyl-D-galactosamine dehydrogenase
MRQQVEFSSVQSGMVGGHRIGVGPYYLTHKSEHMGYHPEVVFYGRRINDNMARYAGQSVVKKMLINSIDVARSTIGVMGITFKEYCPDIRNNKALDLMQELMSWNIKTVVVDPWVDPNEVFMKHGITPSSVGTLSPVDRLVVDVGHQQFRQMTPTMLSQMCRCDNNPVIGDLKSLYDRQAVTDFGFEVFRL